MLKRIRTKFTFLSACIIGIAAVALILPGGAQARVSLTQLQQQIDAMQQQIDVMNTRIDDSTGLYYTISRAYSGIDNGVLPYVVQATKQSDDTVLKVTFTTNMRVAGNAKCCSWEILVDGQPANPKIDSAMYSSGANLNLHHTTTMSGIVEGLSAGDHTISVSVGPCGGYGICDCYTGWNSATILMVEERAAFNP